MISQGSRWAIFYTDGSVFTSADGKHWAAPRTGVQAIASSKDEKDRDWYMIQQVDRYYYEKDKGGWNDCVNNSTFWLHMLRARYPCVVFGEMMSDAKFAKLFNRISKWCDKHREWLVGLTDERPTNSL